MAEIKRGYSSSDLISLIEKRALAPFPPWAAWEHSLEKEMGEDVYQNQFAEIQKDALHALYVFELKKKLGKDADSDEKKYEDLHKQLLDGNMAEEDNPKFGHAISYLRERVSKFRKF
jgi:hypothetical protein